MFLSLFAAFLAGTVLGGEGMVESIEAFPGLLLIVPAFLAMRGNVYGVLGARISTALHQGVIKPDTSYNEKLVNAIIAAMVNGVLISLFIGVSGYSILFVLGRTTPPMIPYFTVLVVAGFTAGVALTALLVTFLFVGYRLGIDPDIINGPVITSIGDFIGTIALFITILAVRWFFGI